MTNTEREIYQTIMAKLSQLRIAKAIGVQCPRCYRFTHSMNFNNLCNRCVAILCKTMPDLGITKQVIEQIESRGLKPSDNPEWDNV